MISSFSLAALLARLLFYRCHILLVVAFAVLLLGIIWVSCEARRVHLLLRKQHILNEREIALRSELQEAYNELEISVRQQKELIVEVDRLYHEQARAAITDVVTGLPNHRAVMKRIDEELACCTRLHTPCAFLFLDIDHFKRVNDMWGHRAGDAVLCDVALRLRSTIHEIDFVGRYGGEEFALLLPGTDGNRAAKVAEQLRQTIAAYPCLWRADDSSSSIAISITVSIGVAIYGVHGMTPEQLIEQADQAMYYAKQSGRNRVCIPNHFEATRNAQSLAVTAPPQVENKKHVAAILVHR